MSSDIELLDAWQGGDKTAGNALIERHFDPLYRFFRNKVNEPVEDLVQRTLLSCVKYRDRVRSGASFRAYMFRIARNELFDFFKGRARGEHLTDFQSASVEDLNPSPSAVVAAQQEQRVVVAALRRIPVDFQVLLELHYFESVPAHELAEIYEVATGTMKSRIRRGKELLRDAVREIIDDPATAESTVSSLDAWAASLRACMARN